MKLAPRKMVLDSPLVILWSFLPNTDFIWP